MIRERVRAMPANIAQALDAQSNTPHDVRMAIDAEVDTALADIRVANGGKRENDYDDEAA